MPIDAQRPSSGEPLRAWSIFLIFLRLGLTSFGGPVAHLGYFRDEFVQRRRWLDERGYADLVALCQFLPGPASSQVGLAIGLLRGGYRGSLAAWAGFTLPSAVALTLFALGIARWGDALPGGFIQGLKIVAVAVVAQAVWGMARTLCSDGPRLAIMLAAASAVLLLPFVWSQVAIIVVAGLIGLLAFRPTSGEVHPDLPVRIKMRTALSALAAFFALLILLPVLAGVSGSQALAQVDAFYRTGALVFGGGHVVLPLLQAEVVPSGWVDNDAFLAGYGAAQAVPGPLFTFAAFLGASMNSGPSGWLGATICLLAVFAPSFLLVFGALPFWERLRGNRRSQAALAGVNAAVVGLLLAALYDPVWTSAIKAAEHFILAVLAFAALNYWKLPPWLVVIAGALGGGLLGLTS
ncbi:chromate efflux transporter [Stutzerimonas stutzeri]|uniref:chromate efflux transporter n=1 Tax=Stutzerimonas stutzeri TaxID=316 RepID=UPI00169C56F9|nr:chromate efflux transporter [Stutzerimonas stutzeri]NIM30940.1 chromate efflux transporter [Stutzerimonas stutzeri]NIM54147.1 chromate efflux transporter [Stutzerimonas stutzeri]NIM86453.1 chromate efflux transporter [Stutzerimonas stutzeri]NIN81049.1 chromate efflux transporter [Stutzerimonas stutzeri]NIP00296.1 chromate efflux transporter [Stutzerimonas stutzeri]